MGEPRKPGIAETLITLASGLVMVWLTMPPAEQYWLKLRILAAAHQITSKLAWREGHRGMGDELSGRDFARYSLTYRISRGRDLIARALEEMRP